MPRMFCPDVLTLKQFYATPLGRTVVMLVRARIKRLWPHVASETTLAVGFALPFAEAQMVCMPAAQGAMAWPAGENRVLLAHEGELPVQDASVNRVLLVHSVEHAEQLGALMQEVWRVLVPGGRAMLIVPNRLSIWSHSAKSPFGYGRPFSIGQVRDMLATSRLTYLGCHSALFSLPTHMPWLLKLAPKLEWLGQLLMPRMGGVLLVEAEKQIYAGIKQPVIARRIPRTEPDAVPQPV